MCIDGLGIVSLTTGTSMGVVCDATHSLSVNAIYRTLKAKRILIPSVALLPSGGVVIE
jgi:hypothetical protein